MSQRNPRNLRLTEKDLDFLVETASPDVADKGRLKQIMSDNEDFRSSFLTDEKVFKKVIGDGEVFLKISPALFFEVLLRKAAQDLEGASYTVERSSTKKIPVFDTKEVAELLTNESLLLYLVDMLTSFTKIEGYAISIRIRKGV